jgi:hypothetical protein
MAAAVSVAGSFAPIPYSSGDNSRLGEKSHGGKRLRNSNRGCGEWAVSGHRYPRLERLYGLDWSTDGNGLWAAARNNKGTQALLHVGFDAKISAVLSYQNEDLDWAVPSPDGRRLAVLKENNSSNVWLLDSREGPK